MSSTEQAIIIGRTIARAVFAKRGNHSEAHITETELAALLAIAAEQGMRRQEGRRRLVVDKSAK